MGALVLAWLVGEGIIVYRAVKVKKCPPGPGPLLYSSGIFVLLALLAESEKARTLAVTLAWGFDIAAFMKLFDKTPLKDTLGSGATEAGQPGSWPPPQLPDTVIFPTAKITGKMQPRLTPPSQTSPTNPPPVQA